MAIYITGSISGSQLNYNTGDATSVKNDLGISLLDISGLNNAVFTTGNQIISGVKTFVDDTIFGTGDLALLVDDTSVYINNLTASGNSNFVNRPLVSSIPVLLSGDINLAGYITTGQTGAFYPASNPSGFITGVNIDPYLASGNVVFTTGNQTISGVKTFLNQTNVSGVKFNVLTPEQVPAYQEGLVFYSDDYHTLNIYPDIPSVSLQVGQENWVRVKNGLSQTVNAGSVVYITGTNGVNPGFQLSIATNEGQSARTLGVVANTMTPNNPGYVTTFGVVNGIDTTSYSVGQTLYLSTSGSGQLSSLRPTAPNHMVRIGTVLTSKNDGSIFVTVQNGFELDELHDVSVTGAASGQFLYKNNGIWNAKTPLISDISGLQLALDQKQITGSYYLDSNPSGFITGVDLSNYITSFQTGGFYPASNPSGFITSVSANVVYTTGDQTINGQKSFTQRPTLNGTGFLLSGEASAGGDYYPNSNPSGFITGVDLSNYITNSQTGVFYPTSNPSGFLTAATVSGSYVASIPTNISGASQIKNMIRITQSGYNALTPDAETLYIIVG